MSKIEIKVGPPPPVLKRSVPNRYAEIHAAMAKMPEDSWFIVPGSPELTPRGQGCCAAAINRHIEEKQLEGYVAARLAVEEGGGVMVRRIADPIREPKPTPRPRATPIGGR